MANLAGLDIDLSQKKEYGFISLHLTRLILGSRLANERRRYKVTSSLIGWTQT